MRPKALRWTGLILVALALLGASCKSKKDSSATKEVVPQPTAAATPRQPDPNVLAKQAADQVEALKSFHFLLEHENGGSPIVLNLTMNRAEGDIAKPDRLKADINAVASQLGGANVKVKVVNVGDTAQITNPFNPNQWVPLPGTNRLADIFDPAAGTTAALRAVQNPKITGEETINGVKVWKVEGNVAATALSSFATIAEEGYTVKGTAWVGEDKPYVYRIRIDGPLGSKDAKNIVRKVELSNFDQPVEIKLP